MRTTRGTLQPVEIGAECHYYSQGKRWWRRLQEEGGKQHDMPAHHTLEAYLDEYVKAAGNTTDPKGPSSAPPRGPRRS